MGRRKGLFLGGEGGGGNGRMEGLLLGGGGGMGGWRGCYWGGGGYSVHLVVILLY